MAAADPALNSFQGLMRKGQKEMLQIEYFFRNIVSSGLGVLFCCCLVLFLLFWSDEGNIKFH